MELLWEPLTQSPPPSIPWDALSPKPGNLSMLGLVTPRTAGCLPCPMSPQNCMVMVEQSQVWVGSEDSIIYILNVHSMSCSKQLTDHRYSVTGLVLRDRVQGPRCARSGFRGDLSEPARVPSAPQAFLETRHFHSEPALTGPRWGLGGDGGPRHPF